MTYTGHDYDGPIPPNLLPKGWIGYADVTQLYCPKNQSGGAEGEDNTTHHLLPRAKGMTCRDCGKTEKQLREEAS